MPERVSSNGYTYVGYAPKRRFCSVSRGYEHIPTLEGKRRSKVKWVGKSQRDEEGTLYFPAPDRERDADRLVLKTGSVTHHSWGDLSTSAGPEGAPVALKACRGAELQVLTDSQEETMVQVPEVYMVHHTSIKRQFKKEKQCGPLSPRSEAPSGKNRNQSHQRALWPEPSGSAGGRPEAAGPGGCRAAQVKVNQKGEKQHRRMSVHKERKRHRVPEEWTSRAWKTNSICFCRN